jgi:hypothetical protein
MIRKRLSDDDLLALVLIHTWTLVTGRTLRSDVPPQELSEEELIDFWADDQGPFLSGRTTASSDKKISVLPFLGRSGRGVTFGARRTLLCGGAGWLRVVE